MASIGLIVSVRENGGEPEQGLRKPALPQHERSPHRTQREDSATRQARISVGKMYLTPFLFDPFSVPYVIVKAAADDPDTWIVRDSGRTDARGTAILISVDGPGCYRIYIKECTETFVVDSEFEIPDHALADGADSGREVQPLLQLDIVENADCSLTGRQIHPNGLGRA